MVMPNKPRVGFLAFGVHVGVKDFTEQLFVQDQHQNAAVKALEKAGIEVEPYPEVVYLRAAALQAVRDLNTRDLDCLILYSATWVWSAELVQATREASVPILLWCEPRSQGWPTVGALVVHGALDEIGIEHKFVYGFGVDEEVSREIFAFAQAAKIMRRLRSSTVGAIGGRGMGETTGMVDPSQWMQTFGVDVYPLDTFVLIKEAEEVEASSVQKTYMTLRKRFKDLPDLDSVGDRSIRLYHAISKIRDDYRFDFMTVNSFPTLGDHYANACLAYALHLDERFVISEIGDINVALSAEILNCLSEGPVFNSDIQHVDTKKDEVKLVADGSCPPSLAGKNYPATISEHGLETEDAEGGWAVTLVCKPGPVTLCHLCRIKGKINMCIATGDAFEPPKNQIKKRMAECGLPSWPQPSSSCKAQPRNSSKCSAVNSRRWPMVTTTMHSSNSANCGTSSRFV